MYSLTLTTFEICSSITKACLQNRTADTLTCGVDGNENSTAARCTSCSRIALHCASLFDDSSGSEEAVAREVLALGAISTLAVHMQSHNEELLLPVIRCLGSSVHGPLQAPTPCLCSLTHTPRSSFPDIVLGGHVVGVPLHRCLMG